MFFCYFSNRDEETERAYIAVPLENGFSSQIILAEEAPISTQGNILGSNGITHPVPTAGVCPTSGGAADVDVPPSHHALANSQQQDDLHEGEYGGLTVNTEAEQDANGSAITVGKKGLEFLK